MQLNITSTVRLVDLVQKLEVIRSHHIDIESLIVEELESFLSQYIEDIIINVYNIKIEGVKQ